MVGSSGSSEFKNVPSSKIEINGTFILMTAVKKSRTKDKKTQPIILITNDDSITAPGIRYLVEAVKDLGRIVVVAPDKPQSGMGHAITVNDVLRMNRSPLHPELQAYTCSGTPVDCVKLAIYELFKGKPDLILSGINHGENTSTNVLYSGTMSAAIAVANKSSCSSALLSVICNFSCKAHINLKPTPQPHNSL